MPHLNIELKARCEDVDRAREVLRSHAGEFVGVDHQVDTYYECNSGRLKLRIGDIERALIFHRRPDEALPHASEVSVVDLGAEAESLGALLTDATGVAVVVDKRREIYLSENVKLHLDEVEGLGAFLEIEARDLEGVVGEGRLREQCEEWMTLLGIAPDHLVAGSYSDLLADRLASEER